MQADVYLSNSIRIGIGTSNYKEWLDRFVNHTHRTDILDVTDEDENEWLLKVYEEEPTNYRKQQAKKAIRGIRIYYRARSKNASIRPSKGRPPALEAYHLVGQYHDENKLSFRKIGILLNPVKPVDVAQVYRFYKRFISLKK